MGMFCARLASADGKKGQRNRRKAEGDGAGELKKYAMCARSVCVPLLATCNVMTSTVVYFVGWGVNSTFN